MDLDKIKRNVAKMAAQNAPPEHINGYIESEGATIEQVRAHKLAPDLTEEQKKAQELAAWADKEVANEPNLGSRDFARGIPVIGSFLDEGMAAAEAGLNAVTGGYFGDPYEKSLAKMRARNRRDDSQSTTVASLPLIGDVTIGGLRKFAGGLASAGATPVLNVFRGQTMLPQAANLGLTGAVLAGGHGAGEGETGKERLQNALMGTAIGAPLGFATPVVARGVSNAFEATRNALAPRAAPLRDYHRTATRNVAETMADDGLTLPGAYADQARRLGPEGMIADMGEASRLDAAALARMPGSSRSEGIRAVRDRAAGAAGRINRDMDAVLGPPENMVALEQQVRQSVAANADPLYRQFRSTQVQMTPRLAAAVQRAQNAPGAVAEAQRKLAVDGFNPQAPQNTGMYLDALKRAVDDLADSANRAGRRDDFRIYSRLSREIRDGVDSALNPGNPGASIYAQARRVAGEGKTFQDGIDAGQQAFAKRTHPDQMEYDLAQMSDIERAGYQAAARGQIRDIMGNSATQWGENGANAALRNLGSEYARRKIALAAQNPTALHGTTRAQQGYSRPERLTRRLDTETEFNRTRAAVEGNSVTSQTQAAQKKYPIPGERNRNISDGLTATVKRVGLKIVDALFAGAIDDRRRRIAADAARIYFAQGGNRDQLARALIAAARQRGVRGREARLLEDYMQRMLAGQGARAASGATASP